MKKISFFIIFLIFNISLFANVKLIAPDFFIKGESYIFEYEASGNSVKFPKIEIYLITKIVLLVPNNLKLEQ